MFSLYYLDIFLINILFFFNLLLFVFICSFVRTACYNSSFNDWTNIPMLKIKIKLNVQSHISYSLKKTKVTIVLVDKIIFT